VGYGLPSNQTVNGVGGRLRARDVKVGCQLWTLDGDRTVRTSVMAVETVKVREVVDIVTDHVTFTVAPDHMLGTPDGWVHARDAEGTVLAWTPARKLRRERLTIKAGYEFGYMIGASCSDGTLGKNYVSLVVNDEGFASRYAACLMASTGLSARLEAVTRPSGYLQRDVPGFRVRVVSSYLADLMRQFVGGDAHHMRQGFPRVVLRELDTGARGAATQRQGQALHSLQLPVRPAPRVPGQRPPGPPTLVSVRPPVPCPRCCRRPQGVCRHVPGTGRPL
jgi:hypothetical protein